MKTLNKIKNFINRHRYWTAFGLIAVIGVAFFATRGPEEATAESVAVSRATISEEVSVTGRVVPAREVALGVQTGGRVSSVKTSVGDRVSAGKVLLTVEIADLEIRLERQRAALNKAELALSTQEPNSGDAESDLNKAYEDGFNTVADAFLDLPSIISGIEDILSSDYLARNTILNFYSQMGVDLRNKAGDQYYAAESAYSDLLRKYKISSRQDSFESIEVLIDETYDATKLIADAVKATNNIADYVEREIDEEDRSGEMSADQESLDQYTAETNSHLLALLDILNTIKDSKDAIVEETNDTESSRIDTRQAELDIEDTLVQINNRTIKSPINGVVTDISAEVGENISQGSPVITIISSSQYEIEANIPEADMAKVSVGAETEVILDAYGSDAVFMARVVSVNPAETLIDGVATYRTKFQFIDNDERIKSGMTANLRITGKSVENVIAVPQRSVITRGGIKYVRVIEEGAIVEKTVETGLRGSDGNIEIVSGLSEGEKVVIFSE